MIIIVILHTALKFIADKKTSSILKRILHFSIDIVPTERTSLMKPNRSYTYTNITLQLLLVELAQNLYYTVDLVFHVIVSLYRLYQYNTNINIYYGQ